MESGGNKWLRALLTRMEECRNKTYCVARFHHKIIYEFFKCPHASFNNLLTTMAAGRRRLDVVVHVGKGEDSPGSNCQGRNH